MDRSLRILMFACFAIVATAFPAPDAVDPDSLQCLSSLNAYETAYTSWFSEIVTETITSSADGQWLSSEVPYTTLCDGRPRALAEKSRWVTSSVTFDPPQTMTRLQGRENTNLEYSTYPEPSPTCTIADSVCKSFHSSYTSSLSDYYTNNAPSPTVSPLCTVYRPCSENSDYCFIHGGGAKVYYWPVTTTAGDFCAYNGSTIFAAPTNPPSANTAVTDGHTFTSPTNYLSLRGVQAYIHSTRRQLFECGGASYSDVLVPLTETLSSFASATQTSVQESFNFENFNTVPASAWDAQRRCKNGRNCNEIGVDYTPLIPLPTEILNLEPKEWKAAGCKGTDYTGYQLEHVALVTPVPTATGRVRL